MFQRKEFRALEWMNIYNADGVANVPQAINYIDTLGNEDQLKVLENALHLVEKILDFYKKIEKNATK